MKLLLAGVLAFSALTLHYEEAPQDLLVGGWGNVDPADANSEMDEAIRERIPELKDAKLIEAETQVVSGINYRNTYLLDNTKYVVTLWDQPWENNRSITAVERIVTSTN